MANVQLEAGKSSAVKTRYSDQKNSFNVWNKPVRLLVAKLYRFWWHTKAYGTILGIMVMVLVSLVVLSLYWLYRNLVQVSVLSASQGVGQSRGNPTTLETQD